jgi:hypothetical protein
MSVEKKRSNATSLSTLAFEHHRIADLLAAEYSLAERPSSTRLNTND